MTMPTIVSGEMHVWDWTTKSWLPVTADMLLNNGANLVMTELPTADPEVAGQLWNDGGIVTVSDGPP